MKNFSLEKILVNRQLNEKWKFPDFNGLLRKMRCNNIFSFQCSNSTLDEFSYDVPVSTCKFSSKWKSIIAVANENGIVCIQNVSNSKPLKYVQTHKNTVYDIAWMPQNCQFVTVSGDNSAKLWNCSDSDVSLISTFKGHKRSVRCVSFKPENNAVFATGSRDGSLMIWDVRASQKCAKFSHHLPDQIIPSGAGLPVLGTKKTNLSLEQLNSKSVTGLIFQNDNTLISCGSMDNIIRVWDMRKTYSRSTSNSLAKYQMSSPHSGFSYLCMNTSGTKLYANCMDSYIYCYNINSYDSDPVAAFYGHENGSFYIKSGISFDGLYLMSGSSDDTAYIWNTRNAELKEEAIKPLLVLNSHSAEVTCVEISPDNMVIVTCSDDGTFRLWNSYAKNLENNEEPVFACSYDETKHTPVIKTKWRNKRKIENVEMPEIIKSNIEDCAPHTKICRFYLSNFFSSCICHENLMQKKGEKRIINELENDQEITKKKALSCINAAISLKKEINREPLLPKMAQLTEKQINSLKMSSKRKIVDFLNCNEENQKSRKIHCSGILTLNTSNSNELNKIIVDEFNFNLCSPKLDFKKEVKKNEPESLSQDNITLGLTSPTCNLPNYVEDGTSPYIHRCPKIAQKENDWLTKLKKSYQKSKNLDADKLNLTLVTPPVREKRKKITSGEPTLHKYFKVSSKTTEKSYNSQELQKKTVMIN